MSKFEQMVAARRAKEAEEAAAKAQPIVKQAVAPEFQKYVPTQDMTWEKAPEDVALDAAIDQIGILEAYRRWCGKMTPQVLPGQIESIKVSCPNPPHPDKNPSAWLNTEKGTGYCASCDIGFDKFDLAAWHHNVGDYKNGKNFHDLRRKIGQELGFTVVQGANQTYVVPPAPPAPPSVPDPDPVQTIEQVAALPSAVSAELDAEDEADLQSIYTKIDWRTLLPEKTFLRTWMEMNSDDDSPEEYHFWTGCLAISFVLGQRIRLEEEHPVQSNLFVCFVGDPGAGKSKAKKKFDMLMAEAMPWDENTLKGVVTIGGSGSGEHLISRFVKPVMDPQDPKRIAYHEPIRGFVDYGELADMMKRASRQGSTLSTTLMEFSDGSPRVSTGSLTHGNLTAEKPFAQILTTTQPGTIRKLFQQADADSGFLSRWIFAPGMAKPVRPVVFRTTFDITDAAAKLKRIDGFFAAFDKMEWSQLGVDAYTKFYFDQIDPIKRQSQNKNLVVRLDLMAKRIMMIFAADNGRNQITPYEVEQFNRLFPYMIATYGNLGKQLARTEASDVRDKILYTIKRLTERNKVQPSKKQIFDAVGRKAFTDIQITRTLKTLMELDLIFEVPPIAGRVGRPTVRYGIGE
jgi:hypothetical protein